MSQPGQQSLLKHILSNILRSKGNQTIKFGQLKEYNIKSIFLEKSYTKCGGVTIPRPFSETLKLRISLDEQFHTVCFYCIPSWGLSKYIECKL